MRVVQASSLHIILLRAHFLLRTVTYHINEYGLISSHYLTQGTLPAEDGYLSH